MNTLRTVAEAGVTTAKGVASPENQRAALLAVTEKGQELAKAAPGAASQASLHPKSSTLPLLKPTIKVPSLQRDRCQTHGRLTKTQG